jgi:hypothetical protein
MMKTEKMMRKMEIAAVKMINLVSRRSVKRIKMYGLLIFYTII